MAAEILRGAESHDSTAVVFAGAERQLVTSVGRLVADAQRVAGALQGLGIRPDDVVAVQVPNWYEGAVAQAAIALTGATLLPVVPIYGPHELGFILRQSRAALLVVPARYRGRDHTGPLAAAGPLPHLRAVVVIGERAPEGMLHWTDLRGRLARPYAPVGPDPEDRSVLVYTSGTTAEPKGVQHTHRSLLAEVRTPVLERNPTPTSMQLAVFPSGHVAGLLGLLRILVCGVPTVVLDGWHPARAAALMDEHQVTASVGAPIHLAGLLDELDNGRVSLDSLREYMVGAAGVPAALVERADAAGIAAYRCYGSSEHPTITSGEPTDSLVQRATTDGRAIAGNEVRLVDDSGRDGDGDGDGEIVTRGPELFLGYTDRDLDHESFLPGGWFRTGDVGRVDADGYLTVTDRKKDIIVRGGENLSSREIEDVLARHPDVVDAAAVGLPDDRYGERVCAVVVLRDGGALGLDDVRDLFVTAGVARQKTPERLVVVDDLPRTAAGKVRKHLLRAQVRGADDPVRSNEDK